MRIYDLLEKNDFDKNHYSYFEKGDQQIMALSMI
jgi:hypothetical protein